MKIGILTYQRAINYGAFLQAFALRSYLQQCGHDVDIIDYMPEGHSIAYNPLHINRSSNYIDYLLTNIRNIIRLPFSIKRIKRMESLQKRHLQLDSEIAYKHGEQLAALDYDCIVYGSDQIWWKHSPLPTYTGFDNVFWGDYIRKDIRKITYAASMGVIDLTEEDKLFIQSSLRSFSAISVREEDLMTTIQPLTKEEVELVIDPVLIVGKDFWEKYATRQTPNKPYVLLYSLLPSREAEDFAKNIAEKKNCKYIEITGRIELRKLLSGAIQTADAFDLISFIRNADYVVSTSFHGTAFSVLFEKQFIAFGMKKNSSRVHSLLKQLGIEERLLTEEQPEELEMINYSNVSVRLALLREKSHAYLQKAICNSIND